MAYTLANLQTDVQSFGNQWLLNRTDTTVTGTVASSTVRWYDRFLNISGPIDARSQITPSAAVAPTSATSGSIPLRNGGAARLTLIGVDGDWRGNTSNATAMPEQMPYIICDRLSHQGGLSGIVTGAQTTNLPTAALTRYTSGVGVMLGISVYTALGATGVDVTASYTNSDGTSGQTTTAYPIPTSAPANSLFILPLAAGDKGVQAVASVTLSATTGTAGNFGVTLFKPIGMWLPQYSGGSLSTLLAGNMLGGLPQITDNACLFAITSSRLTPATCNILVTEI